MNFDHMPELRWELGYPGVIAFMLLICSFLYFRFKRAGWL
jgi:magnesium transporter